jgi:hypothetical protein
MCPAEPRPANAVPVIAVAAPATPHERQTSHDGEQWRWRDGRRHSLEAPPDIPSILRDKLQEHGAPAVVEVVGLSRVAVLGVAAGVSANAGSWFTIGMRLVGLARLDAQADARAGLDADDGVRVGADDGVRRP